MFTTRAGLTPDLGHEPPLDASGSNAEFIDRREVSLRWLGASVLVGVTGGALIGASIYIAFQGLTSLVQQPQRAKTLSYYSQDQDDKQGGTAVRKGDKLIRQESSTAESKDGIRIPITIRTGDREVIKMRRFVRIATQMSPTTGLYATNIPPFNPMKLMTQGGEEPKMPEPPPEVSDADVSVTRANLAGIVFGDRQPALNDDDALAQLEAERSLLLQRGQRSGLPISPQFMFSRSLPNMGQLPDVSGQDFGGKGLFSSIEIRVIPENVTNVAKVNAPSSADLEERELVLKKGETLTSLLLTNGATPEQTVSILKTLQTSIKVQSISEGQKVRILNGLGQGLGDGLQVLRVSIANERSVVAIAAMNDRGTYVSVAPSDESETDTNIQVAEDDEPEANERLSTARLYESLFETAAKNNMPTSMVDDLVRIFGSDVDFQRRVTPSDSIEILYAVDEDNNDRPEMQFAAFTTGGETRRVYRYQGDDGNVDYLDEQGRSLKRFLLRKPITDGIMRSTFGMRRHPVLGYSKLHSGVDWANKIGTPILAAGNGTLVKAGWQSGYGQHIEIQHANGYLTTYSHMSRFAVGMSAGVRVRQGQVIGYVGNTGLSTGPHLHYEVKVNDRFVDPLKIRVPRGRELDGRALAEFKRQQEQVNSALEKAGSTIRIARGGTD